MRKSTTIQVNTNEIVSHGPTMSELLDSKMQMAIDKLGDGVTILSVQDSVVPGFGGCSLVLRRIDLNINDLKRVPSKLLPQLLEVALPPAIEGIESPPEEEALVEIASSDPAFMEPVTLPAGNVEKPQTRTRDRREGPWHAPGGG